eukprot:256869_1
MASQTNSNKAFPTKFKVVEHVRGHQQAGTTAYAQPKIIIPNFTHEKIHKKNVIDVNESKIQNIDAVEEICVVKSDDTPEPENQSTEAKSDDNQQNDEVESAEQENVVVAQVEQISKLYDDIDDDQDGAIINCIGRVYFRLNTNDENLHSGTGTVIKKFANDFIAILTCAHVVVKDDGNEVDRIWFSSNSEDRNDNDR